MLTREQIDGHVNRIRDDGYTIVEDALEPAFVDELAADLERLEQALAATPNKNSFEGHATVRVYNLLVHGALYQRIPVHEHVLPIVERVLDPGCLVSSLSSIAILPGEKPQPIHADDQLIPVPKPHVPFVCNSMWAITDFTADNGATRIIPGSHTRDASPMYGQDYPEAVPAVMKRGSVMVYNGSLWHGGGPNTTDARRVGIAMNYCAGYIRQQENQQLGIPRDIAKTFATRLRELVGYSIYRQIIGHIDHGHPARVLDD